MRSAKAENQSITKLLHEWSRGKREVLDELVPLIYSELHRQAHNYLRHERAGHTLQTTALINEAFLKLADQEEMEWESRTHFFAIAANTMRRILIDYARAKNRKKRGGDAIRLSLSDQMLAVADERTVDLIALDVALDRLEELDPQQARVVELRYFSGLTLEETADVLKISRATVAREWNVARAWLRRELTRQS